MLFLGIDQHKRCQAIEPVSASFIRLGSVGRVETVAGHCVVSRPSLPKSNINLVHVAGVASRRARVGVGWHLSEKLPTHPVQPPLSGIRSPRRLPISASTTPNP